MWRRAEKFALEPDYRIPHDLSNDYWLYECFAGLAADHYDTLLIGDSVIWGEYVTRQETLSHYLNELAGQERFANLGLDGAHPLALGGLVEFYAESISGKNVLLQCNPLWMSSRRADLQDDRTDEFNHPRLVPQFAPSIPAYKAEISPRLGVLVERRLPLEHLDGPPSASLLRPDRHPRLDPGASLRQPADAAHAGAASLGQFAPAPAAALVQERHREAGLSVGRSGYVVAMAGFPGRGRAPPATRKPGVRPGRPL